MNERSRRWLLWSPRILAVTLCLFLSLFALDASGDAEFALHVAPVLLLLGVVVISWRWEWVGACVFTGVGIVYAYIGRDHLSWMLCISVPPVVVGVLYGWNWRHHRQLHAPA